MVYEIEKRSLFQTQEEFEKAKKRITEVATTKATYDYTTFLFAKPEYLRIRTTKGESYFVVTKKTGTYSDDAREETEQRIPLEELKSYISRLESSGFTHCVKIHAKSAEYTYDNCTIACNEIEHLGNFVEVEALSTDSDEVSQLLENIQFVMHKFDLTELDASLYQQMMDELYEKHTKNVNEQFPFSSKKLI